MEWCLHGAGIWDFREELELLMARKKKKSEQQGPKEEIAEDYCFICKDGGELLICEYK